MNKRQIIGRLGQDAKQGTTKKGNPCTIFSVAAHYGFAEQKGTEWVDCFMNEGSKVLPYLTAGQLVYVDGDAAVEEYQGKTKTKLFVKTLKLLGGRNEA